MYALLPRLPLLQLPADENYFFATTTTATTTALPLPLLSLLSLLSLHYSHCKPLVMISTNFLLTFLVYLFLFLYL